MKINQKHESELPRPPQRAVTPPGGPGGGPLPRRSPSAGLSGHVPLQGGSLEHVEALDFLPLRGLKGGVEGQVPQGLLQTLGEALGVTGGDADQSPLPQEPHSQLQDVGFLQLGGGLSSARLPRVQKCSELLDAVVDPVPPHLLHHEFPQLRGEKEETR